MSVANGRGPHGRVADEVLWRGANVAIWATAALVMAVWLLDRVLGG